MGSVNYVTRIVRSVELVSSLLTLRWLSVRSWNSSEFVSFEIHTVLRRKPNIVQLVIQHVMKIIIMIIIIIAFLRPIIISRLSSKRSIQEKEQNKQNTRQQQQTNKQTKISIRRTRRVCWWLWGKLVLSNRLTIPPQVVLTYMWQKSQNLLPSICHRFSFFGTCLESILYFVCSVLSPE